MHASRLFSSLPILLLTLLLAACSNSSKNDSASRISHARELISDNRLNAAKIELDSIDLLYPRQVEARRESHHLKDTIALLEAKRTLSYSDSVLEVLSQRSDSVIALFRYEKDQRYQSEGNYIHPALLPQNNPQRCYLQAQVSDRLKLTLRSHYYGSRALRHTLIRLEADSLYLNLHGSCHSFEADGINEITTVSHNECLEALKFIATGSESKATVSLEGTGKPFTYVLSERDKKALARTLELYFLLTDINKLEQTCHKADKQIQFYSRALSDKQ